MNKQADEFYIGWQPEAPDSFATRVRLCIYALLILIPLTGLLLALNQRGFASSTFEFGIASEATGLLTLTPAPFVRVYRGQDISGNSVFQHILLVGPGKHGVNDLIQSDLSTPGLSPEDLSVTVRGSLIYHDGKTLIEVAEIERSSDNAQDRQVTQPSSYGTGSVFGEITDPKCLFGVMKPGYGKPHRACAARCIAGGIPPVLKTISPSGATTYFLIAGTDGEPINQEVLPFAGDQVALCGEIRKVGEWMVLYKDNNKPITLVSDGLGMDLVLCK